MIDAGSMLRHQQFRRFWAGRLLSSLGYQAQAVAFGWQIYSLTDSPFAFNTAPAG